VAVEQLTKKESREAVDRGQGAEPCQSELVEERQQKAVEKECKSAERQVAVCSEPLSSIHNS